LSINTQICNIAISLPIINILAAIGGIFISFNCFCFQRERFILDDDLEFISHTVFLFCLY